MRNLFPLILLAGCATVPAPSLESRIVALETAGGGTIAVAYRDLRSGSTFLHNGHLQIHAASTMKVPLMLAVFQAAREGQLQLDQAVEVRNSFRSLIDGSPYQLDPKEDSDPLLYDRIGSTVPLHELMERMIDRSSNLSTNLLIELVGVERISRLMHEIGADEVHVLRGVEDIKAFEAGRNNMTSASGMLEVLRTIQERKAISPEASEEMLRILEKQEFREKIPAGLPPGTVVANKTGDITTVHNDAAIVDPGGPAPYVLVVMTRGFRDQPAADHAISEISRLIWESRP